MTDNFATKCTPAAGLDQIAASDARKNAFPGDGPRPCVSPAAAADAREV
jgi:hypothetical protein